MHAGGRDRCSGLTIGLVGARMAVQRRGDTVVSRCSVVPSCYVAEDDRGVVLRAGSSSTARGASFLNLSALLSNSTRVLVMPPGSGRVI